MVLNKGDLEFLTSFSGWEDLLIFFCFFLIGTLELIQQPRFIIKDLAQSPIPWSFFFPGIYLANSSLNDLCMSYAILFSLTFVDSYFQIYNISFSCFWATGSLCFTGCISSNTFCCIYGSSQHLLSEFQPWLQVSLFLFKFLFLDQLHYEIFCFLDNL